MKPRFQADADLDEDIVTGLLRRETYIDFQTAEAAGLRARVDSVVREIESVLQWRKAKVHNVS